MAGTTATAIIANNKSRTDFICVIANNAFLYWSSICVAQFFNAIGMGIFSVRSPKAPLKNKPVMAIKTTSPIWFKFLIRANPNSDANLSLLKNATAIPGNPKAIMEASALANCAMEAFCGSNKAEGSPLKGICNKAAAIEKLIIPPKIRLIPDNPIKTAIFRPGGS